MRVSYNWLKEYVDFDLPVEELAARLTMMGLEVDKIEYFGQGIKGVVVGEIVEIAPHPQADKLVVCQVNIGTERIQIVTGATNMAPGNRVPVAPAGAELPGGLKLKKTRLRGIESWGMMCSGKELGLDEALVDPKSREGILILPADAVIGKDVLKALYLNDAVLEIDLTPNRADCLSVINIAREVAAILEKPLNLPQVKLVEGLEKVEDLATVEVLDPDLCNRYVARVVRNVSLKPSPLWMQHYLRTAGIRPINNVVDISNFVMLEMGQPLHTFDYDTLADYKIVVRRAKLGEKMFTLDGEERTFNEENLLICDGEKPVALAGVMGGLSTEVTNKTRNILIEAARFHPVSVRRTSRALGLRSESSLRFEKGLDVHNTIAAAHRAAQLMVDLAGGEISQGVIDVRGKLPETKIINLNINKVNQVLGTCLTRTEIANYLARLKFSQEETAENLQVIVPTYRQDITGEIDLIEEVARIHGYGKIPVTLPQGVTTEGRKTRWQILEDKTKELLAGAGFVEVINYSFISPRDYDLINLPANSQLRRVVKIKNPLSEAQSVMRTTLIPGLLETAARNTHHRLTDFAFYEWGRIFLPTREKLPQELPLLAGLVSGADLGSWHQEPLYYDFFYLKGVLEMLFNRLGVNNWILNRGSLPEFLHPGRGGNIFIGEKRDVHVGFIGEVHPTVQENYHLEKRISVFQMNVNLLFSEAKGVVKYLPIPKYPAVERDMALITSIDISEADIRQVIWEEGGELLAKVTLFDVYKGKQIPQGYQNLAYSLSFRSMEKTLTDKQVNEIFQKILQGLSTKFNIELR